MKSILSSNQWKQDLEETIRSIPVIGQLAGKTVMITGATGLIGSAVTDLLIFYNESHDEKIRILSAGRNRERTERRFGSYSQAPYFSFADYDAAAGRLNASERADYIIHCASNAYPALIVKEPVETIACNIAGTAALLDYAAKNNSKRLLFVSSSEVYGKKEGADPFSETEYGWIDLLNHRNSYSVAKRAAETLCVSYSEEYGVETVIARPGHIYGPTASLSDNRVSSMWAYDAARGKDIVMKSDGMQLRSYCYCLDCAAAILTVLLLGETKEAYNISNCDSVVTIRQMAEMLASAADVKLIREKASDEEKKGFNPMSNSSLESSKLEALGWRGLYDAVTGFSHTVTALKEILE